MKNIAVILAGGVGSRMGGQLPKQFLEIKGRPMICYAIDAFNCHAMIDELAVVVHPQWCNYMEEIAASCRWDKLKKIIKGGDERYLSSYNAVKAYSDQPDDTNLLLHDAARPWVSECIITRVVEALRKHEAVGVAVPSTDTVWEVCPGFGRQQDYYVARIPERKFMWRAQTPQGFRLPLIAEAYRIALSDPAFTATDDCGVVHRYMPEVNIHVVKGERENIKVTHPEDMAEIN